MGSMPSVPGTGDDEKKEAERLRLEAIRQTERERRNKYKKQDDERDVERQKLRDKYNIAKPVNEDEESEDEDDAFGSVKKKEEDDDAVAQAQKLAEKKMEEAKQAAQEKCSIQ